MLRRALEGVVVIDFTQIVAGPTCTMLLADMGADVIKVEPPEGELGRKLGPGWIGNDSVVFHAVNRNKRGISLDLKSSGDRSAARKLVAQADVLVESMRPGVMRRLGLGPEELCAECPKLIYCSISAYGQHGPYARYAGVDGVLQADTGLMGLIGGPNTEPAKVQAPIVDTVTGYLACVGVLGKLVQRAKDGLGGHLDISLMNAAMSLQQSAISDYLATGELPSKIASAAPYSAPNEAFETADGWIMVAAYSGNRWSELCVLLGLPELIADERFATSPKRVAHRDAMRRLLMPAFAARTTDDWLQLLRTRDIFCAPVASYEDLMRHPQVAAASMIVSMSHPALGTIRVPGFPINSAECNAREHVTAPGLGEHTDETLRRFGLSESEIDAPLRSPLTAAARAPVNFASPVSTAVEAVRSRKG
jgi:crotonobetainyl-CoA:carnitine CoA-transferase CaiB-like acyl-CoA transferase